MFEIHPKLLIAFEEESQRRFDEEMVKHSQEFSPRLTEVVSEDELRVLLKQAMAKAEAYGFTNLGPIRLYIELTLLFGYDFDSDPQYRCISAMLLGDGDQMDRAERIWKWVVEYNAGVSPANRDLVRKVEQFLDVFDNVSLGISESDFVAKLEIELASTFPEKVAIVGQEPILDLIQKGRAEAQRYELDSCHSQALIAMLMFLFGHGCAKDPFYPWIKQTLDDSQIKERGVRALQLETKALTWLDEYTAKWNEGVKS